jgi:DNA-binding CsgD family transcriptional regulator
MRSSEAVRHIQHIASMGLSPHEAIPAMLSSLQYVVPTQPNPFFWSAPDGTIRDFFIEEIKPNSMDSSMMLGRHNTPDDVPTFDRLIGGPRLINNTGLLRQMSGWARSAFYNDMLRGNKAENSIDFQLRDASGVRGMFALTRGEKERPIKAAEVRCVAAIAPHFLHAMNGLGTVGDGATSTNPEMAHIIANRRGEIVGTSSNASKMIVQLHNLPLGQGIKVSELVKRLPPAVTMVVERLRLIKAGNNVLPASTEVYTRWGVYRVSAVALESGAVEEPELILINAQRLINKDLVRARRLAETDLTPAERRVALRMASAGEGDAIAHDLGIKTSTYRQYAKRIYTSLGVEGRMGVKAMLDS